MHGHATAPRRGGKVVRERRAGQTRRRMRFPLFFLLSSLSCFLEALGRRRQGSPSMSGCAGPGKDKDIFVNSHWCCFGISIAAAMALGAACSRIIYGNTHDGQLGLK